MAAGRLAGCVTVPREQSTGAVKAEAMAKSFVAAFNALDPVAFDRHFAVDVTMFFPDGPFPIERIEGKPAVTAAFHRFFDAAKAAGRSNLSITPSDLTVQMAGDAAVVSFELTGQDAIGRRSLVLRREADGWKIAHFHASRRERPKP